ncbi:MAG: hypothetical protein SFU27_13045 [Thermonemataceae bacterium]|nr:hypothetical protein [Thermonemataceae bacterium]
MTDTTKNIALKWRQDLLDLKECVKQKQLNTEQALAAAQKLKMNNKEKSAKPNSDIQNAHIQLCDTLEQANKILEEYRIDSVSFTTTTFNILISLSPDQTTATSYFNKLLELGLKPNTYTLNGFTTYCKTVEEGRELIKSMSKYKVKPNTQTYNALLSLTTNDNQRAKIIAVMEDQGIEINLVTFNTLISRSITFKSAFSYYQDLKLRNIKPTINTFITLLKKATTKTEINQTEQLLKDEGIKTNNNWDRLHNSKKYGC